MCIHQQTTVFFVAVVVVIVQCIALLIESFAENMYETDDVRLLLLLLLLLLTKPQTPSDQPPPAPSESLTIFTIRLQAQHCVLLETERETLIIYIQTDRQTNGQLLIINNNNTNNINKTIAVRARFQPSSTLMYTVFYTYSYTAFFCCCLMAYKFANQSYLSNQYTYAPESS